MNKLRLLASNAQGTVQEFRTLDEYKDLVTRYGNVITRIEFVKGSREQSLFNQLFDMTKSNVFQWFSRFKEYRRLSTEQKAAVKWLRRSNNYSLGQALDLAKNVQLFKGYKIDYVRNFVNETFKMTHKLGHLAKYFDYEAYAFDLEREGKICCIHFEDERYTVMNADKFIH